MKLIYFEKIDVVSSRFLDSSYYSGWKNGVHIFFHLKTPFHPPFNIKHLENTLRVLLNQFMASKNTQKTTPQNPKQKIFMT
jgi:hypothetical protein